MRPSAQRLSAPGFTPWVKLNYIANPFSVGLFVSPSVGSTLLGDVQLSFDDPWNFGNSINGNKRLVAIARVGTVATVTDVAHGLATGDSIIVEGAGAPFDTLAFPGGSATVTVVDANSYTYVVANSGLTASQNDTKLGSLRVFNHATLAAVAARANGNIAFPVQAVRFNAGTVTAGTVDFVVLQGSGSL